MDLFLFFAAFPYFILKWESIAFNVTTIYYYIHYWAGSISKCGHSWSHAVHNLGCHYEGISRVFRGWGVNVKPLTDRIMILDQTPNTNFSFQLRQWYFLLMIKKNRVVKYFSEHNIEELSLVIFYVNVHTHIIYIHIYIWCGILLCVLWISFTTIV